MTELTRRNGNLIGTFENQYLELLNEVLIGEYKEDRTGVGTTSVHGVSLKARNVGEYFPLLTSKLVRFKSVLAEYEWMKAGETNIHTLQTQEGKHVGIWDAWADEEGELGPVYGKQWRDCHGVDQLQRVLEGLQSDPLSRRHMINSWNVADLDKMALPPCHFNVQFLVRGQHAFRTLDCVVSQRSGDLFLGIPFNMAFYALMVADLCEELNKTYGDDFHWTAGDVTIHIGDAHIYRNHAKQVQEQLIRKTFRPPRLRFRSGGWQVWNYNHSGVLRGEVAV